MSYFKRYLPSHILIIIVLVPLLILNIYCALNIHRLSSQRAIVKKDYSEVNSIQYGLLSVTSWRDNIQYVISKKIDEFSFTPEQEEVLKAQISKSLNALITEADSLVQRNENTLGGKIRKLVVNSFVNIDAIRKNVPEFTQSIMTEIKKPANREKLKKLISDKLNEYVSETYDTTSRKSIDSLLLKYNAPERGSFDKITTERMNEMQQSTYQYCYIMVGTLVLFLIIWWLIRKQFYLHRILFIFSVLLALIVLVVSLTSPMIEIDARIRELNLVLLGEPIKFHDQVIFFQSKSILNIVKILIKTHKIDSVFVGILVLMFSVLFPVCKLIATEIYLLSDEKWRNNKLLSFFALKSGKWSMADVTVVAIFMAYIGFKGILDDQLQHLNFQTASLTSISTNLTSLQPAFILFLSFVIFGLVLSEILKKIAPTSLH